MGKLKHKHQGWKYLKTRTENKNGNQIGKERILKCYSAVSSVIHYHPALAFFLCNLSVNFNTVIAESSLIYLLEEPEEVILLLRVESDQEHEAGPDLCSDTVISLQKTREECRTGTM